MARTTFFPFIEFTGLLKHYQVSPVMADTNDRVYKWWFTTQAFTLASLEGNYRITTPERARTTTQDEKQIKLGVHVLY